MISYRPRQDELARVAAGFLGGFPAGRRRDRLAELPLPPVAATIRRTGRATCRTNVTVPSGPGRPPARP